MFAAKDLGGTGTPGAQFGLSYDTDPQGTAQSRVSSIAAVGAAVVRAVVKSRLAPANSTVFRALALLFADATNAAAI